MKRLYKEGFFVTSRRSIYIQTKSDIIYSIQQRGIKGVKQSLSVLAFCKPKGICSLAQIEKKSMENGFNQSSVWRMLGTKAKAIEDVSFWGFCAHRTYYRLPQLIMRPAKLREE